MVAVIRVIVLLCRETGARNAPPLSHLHITAAPFLFFPCQAPPTRPLPRRTHPRRRRHRVGAALERALERRLGVLGGVGKGELRVRRDDGDLAQVAQDVRPCVC